MRGGILSTTESLRCFTPSFAHVYVFSISKEVKKLSAFPIVKIGIPQRERIPIEIGMRSLKRLNTIVENQISGMGIWLSESGKEKVGGFLTSRDRWSRMG